MDILFLANALVMLAIAGVIFYAFFRYHKEHKVFKITSRLSILGMIYFIPIILSFLWFLERVAYNASDFILIYSGLLFFQTVILFYTFRFVVKNRVLPHLLLLFGLSLFALFISFRAFLFSVAILSLFLTLLLFTIFFYNVPKFKHVSKLGFLYALVSLVLQIIILFGVNLPYHFSIVSNLLFLLFMYHFLKHVCHYPFNFLKSLAKERSYINLFIDYFTFVAVLTGFVLMATIGVHELGHVLFSNFAGCESRSIFFESGSYPYTEVLCPDDSMKTYALLAGPLLPMAIALFLLIFGGKFTKEVGLLVIGFNLLSSYRDLAELGVSVGLNIATIISGMILLLLGIILISKNRMEHGFPHS